MNRAADAGEWEVVRELAAQLEARRKARTGDRFADEAPEELRWQLPHVHKHRALPLYVGWTETAGIRPDGELVRWSTEDWPGAFELADTWEKVALVKGAERYPILRRLIPPRPASARDCET